MDNVSNKIKRILVATDFSENAHHAILKAVEIADSNAAQLILIHVSEEKLIDKTAALFIPKDILQTSAEYAAILMKKQMQKLSRYQLNIASKIISTGKPALKILQYAKKNKVDLLVVGAHGTYSWRDAFVGTTAEYIAKHTEIPVLIIKNKPRRMDYKILAPVDFSRVSKKALNTAMKIFPFSKISAVHVAESDYGEILAQLKEKNTSQTSINKMRKAILFYLNNKMKKFLHPVIRKLAKPSYTLAFGYPGPTILTVAHQQHRNLIAMGTQGHGRKHYLFIGSVANWLLMETDTDILLVPP